MCSGCPPCIGYFSFAIYLTLYLCCFHVFQSLPFHFLSVLSLSLSIAFLSFVYLPPSLYIPFLDLPSSLPFFILLSPSLLPFPLPFFIHLPLPSSPSHFSPSSTSSPPPSFPSSFHLTSSFHLSCTPCIPQSDANFCVSNEPTRHRVWYTLSSC